MYNIAYENTDHQYIHSTTIGTSEPYDTTNIINTTAHKNYSSFIIVISIIAVIGSIILVILCGVEFYKINSYAEAQCFVVSSQVNVNYDITTFGSIRYRAVWNVILYDNDGTKTKATVWSTQSESFPTWILNNLISQYKTNNTYPCYHQRSNFYPGQIQFDKPSKSKAIGYLIGFIILILFSIILFVINKYIRWRHGRQNIQQQNNAQIQLGNVEAITTTPVHHDSSINTSSIIGRMRQSAETATREERYRHEGSIAPPTYDEAVAKMALSSSRKNLD